ALHLTVDGIAVRSVGGRPLVGVVEECVDCAHRRGNTDLEGHALWDRPLRAKTLVVLVRLLREVVIADFEAEILDPGLDTKVPAVRLRRRFGIVAWRRCRERAGLGLAPLIEVRVAGVDELGQKANPEFPAPTGLAVRK